MSLPLLFSNELNRVPPQSVNYNPLRPYEQHGRVRRSYFTLAVAAQALNTVIGLCAVPKNARVFGGRLKKAGTAGATVQWAIGLAGNDNNGNIDDTVGAVVADSVTFFGLVANTVAASDDAWGGLPTQNSGYVTKKDCMLTIQVVSAAVTAATTLTGYVEYIVD